MSVSNLVGLRFNRLTVISRQGSCNGKAKWKCNCECGANTTAVSGDLKSGRVKSCGCLRTENTRRVLTKHGGASSRSYSSWKSMMSRCYRPNASGYKHYGAAGIKVCEQWHSYQNFVSDMGEPREGQSLDRIDGLLGYSFGNCRWASKKEQSRNRKSNRYVVLAGKQMCYEDAAIILRVDPSTLSKKLRGKCQVVAEKDLKQLGLIKSEEIAA